jgi:hypothetical protein
MSVGSVAAGAAEIVRPRRLFGRFWAAPPNFIVRPQLKHSHTEPEAQVHAQQGSRGSYLRGRYDKRSRFGGSAVRRIVNESG